MTSVWAFVRLSRPHFLLGGALMFAIGVRTADGTTAGTYLLGQAMVTSAQLTAHYVNEYADRHVDRLVANRTLFSGGSGTLVQGDLAPRVALVAALVTSAVTVGLVVAVTPVSTVAAVLGLVALGVSWAYSMPPIRLLDTGWGELVTSLVVTGLVPVVGGLVASGSIGADLLWVVGALLPVHLAMMLAFELPDLESDRAAGKTVLTVRLGVARTQSWVLMLLLLPTGVVAGAVTAGPLDGAAWWAVIAAALPSTLVALAARTNRYPLLTASAVGTLVVLGGGLLLVL